jgi:hypothetical protein
MNPFTWIASRVRSAVVQGFSQGLEDIGAITETPIDPNQALLNLQTKLALPAPTPTTEETEPKSRKKS